MHSVWYRANAVLTLAATVAGVMCLLCTATDFLHKADPQVQASVASIDMLTKTKDGNDQVLLTLNLDADLRSVFSWNTKLVFLWVELDYMTDRNAINRASLWDKIIQSKDEAHIQQPQLRQKYNVVDQGRNLRGRPFNLTVSWNVVPRVGVLRTFSKTFDAGQLLEDYHVSETLRSRQRKPHH